MLAAVRYHLQMVRRTQQKEVAKHEAPVKPTMDFRRRAWREFQRALDPLGSPKPLRLR
jgi:hypothetical protein